MVSCGATGRSHVREHEIVVPIRNSVYSYIWLAFAPLSCPHSRDVGERLTMRTSLIGQAMSKRRVAIASALFIAGNVSGQDLAPSAIASPGPEPGGATAEVERVINQHPAVKESCVYGVTHKQFGQIPYARVVLTDESANFDPNELRRFCYQYLAAYKVPKQVEQVIELEKTLSGKTVAKSRAQLND